MIAARTARTAAAVVLLLLTGAVSGCTSGEEIPADSASPSRGETQDPDGDEAKGESGAAGESGAVSSPQEAARAFSTALARGDAERACALAAPRFRNSMPGGDCAAALADLASDTRWVFTQKSCVSSPKAYEVAGDPQDTATSKRVDVDCPHGYTWLRADKNGAGWQITDLNRP